MAGKRLALLHDLVPKAVNVAVLINPANASSAEYNFRQVQQAAPSFGLAAALVCLHAFACRPFLQPGHPSALVL